MIPFGPPADLLMRSVTEDRFQDWITRLPPHRDSHSETLITKVAHCRAATDRSPQWVGKRIQDELARRHSL